MGIPEGSVLGSLLFLFYINDFPDYINYQTVLLADDVSVIVPHKDITTTHETDISKVVQTVLIW